MQERTPAGIASWQNHVLQLAADKLALQIPVPTFGYILIPGQIFVFVNKD